MLAGKVLDPPDELTDVARIDGLPQLDERVDRLTRDVERKLGVELRRADAFEFGLHFRQRPKCSEELIDQFPFARLRLKHGRRLDSLCSKYRHHTEYSTKTQYLLNSKSAIYREAATRDGLRLELGEMR